MAHEANRNRRKHIAAAGEQYAAEWFMRRGHVLVERNWRSGRFGEIDLIFRRADCVLVFVEVKTRRVWQDAKGFADYGFDAINWSKRRKILIAARSYIGRNCRTQIGYQCDAALVTYETVLSNAARDGVTLGGVKVLHVPNAFDSI
jgi:Holliday junction resolvase-like predicted endonuclease